MHVMNACLLTTRLDRFWPFFRSAWNWIDVIIMAVNLFSAHDDHPFTSFSRSFYTLLGIWQLFLSVPTRPFPSLLPFFFPPHERIHACTIPRQNIGVATGEDGVCVCKERDREHKNMHACMNTYT